MMTHRKVSHSALISCCGLFFIRFSIAHVIWKHPLPRPSNDIKTFPCGQGSLWADGPITDLSVGSNELVFDEFICHAGDMVRIALSMHSDDDYDRHVVLDRLPHNDLCGNSNSNNLMAVNVTLPDVDCVNNECSLQIIQVMASKFREHSCDNPGGIASMCGNRGWMYYSCARVRIAGNLPNVPEQFVDFYGAPNPERYKWPLVANWFRDSPTEPWRLATPMVPPPPTQDLTRANGTVQHATTETVAPTQDLTSINGMFQHEGTPTLAPTQQLTSINPSIRHADSQIDVDEEEDYPVEQGMSGSMYRIFPVTSALAAVLISLTVSFSQ